MRPAAKRDGNEDAIKVALEAAGYKVASVSASGHPDLLVGSPVERRLFLIECKQREHPKLTAAEKRFHATWTGFPVYVAFNVADALMIARQFN